MEWKIGEIKQINGEWYQCIEEKTCTCFGCDFRNYNCDDLQEIKGSCQSNRRKDNKSVIFKKLKKVGEPYFNGQYGEVLQEYKYYIPPITPDLRIHIIRLGIVGIELKQNKEDMEEGKLDPHMEKIIDEAAQKLGDEISKQLIENLNKQRMKPFNLEAAKAGRPVCTRDGRKARIICFDAKFPKTGNIVTLVEKENGEEVTLFHHDDGHCSIGRAYDLMMLPEKKEGWIIVSKNATIYDSLEDAKKSFDSDKELCICKAEWEE